MLFRKKALERQHKEITVDVMDEQVVVREMSTRDRLKSFADARINDEIDSALMCFTVLVRSAYQDGKRVFENSDALKLADAPFDADIDKLCADSLRINGLAPSAPEEAEGN